MVNPRDVLNKLKWDYKNNLDEAEIWYAHRGVLNDTKIIRGDKIKNVGRSFMETENGMIPFHRVFKIKCKDKIIFDRRKKL